MREMKELEKKGCRIAETISILLINIEKKMFWMPTFFEVYKSFNIWLVKAMYIYAFDKNKWYWSLMKCMRMLMRLVLLSSLMKCMTIESEFKGKKKKKITRKFQ